MKLKPQITSLALLCILILLIWLAGEIYQPLERNSNKQVEININKGQSALSVGSTLTNSGLINNRYLFFFYTILTNKWNNLQAGKYTLSPSMSISKIAQVINEGLTKPEGTLVTIPEGTNVADVDKILQSEGIIKNDAFINQTSLAEEGYLFPDTYRFIPGTGYADIIGRMHKNFELKLEEAGLEYKKKEFKQVIIIASILEKEVRNQNDMRVVAGIIKNRIARDMPLELDATVAYGACLPKFEKGKYCDVSGVNLVDSIPKDSLYNTYRRKGLPSGPISNPGLIAIKAALNPVASDYLYYLNTSGGTTIFSKTAAEHVKARRKYLNK